MRYRYWLPASVLALGLASVLILYGTDRLRGRLIAVDIELGQSVRDVQTQLSKSHLWLEEYVTGDEVGEEEIWQDRESSLQLLRTVLDGIDPADGQTESAELRARSTETKARRFWEITEERYGGFQRGEDVGVGSPIDVEYDAVFYDLLAELQSLQGAVETRLESNRERWGRWFIVILLAWISLVGFAVFGLSNHERRRFAAEQALHDSQQQLLQSQKMDAVGRLAGGIAHDINNYLAAIRAQCELIGMKAEAGSTIRRRMDTVVATTTKAAALITRLLAFSRREPVQARVTELNRVVQRLSRMLGRLIGEDIRLQKRLAPGLWNVKIDRSQLEQVIMNLVINAREAMATGGTLTLETDNRPAAVGANPSSADGRDYVVLIVADTGSGVPPGIQDKLFEPFFTTKEGNSGLGLSTVYGIIEQNDGFIRLVSADAHGTRFEVGLPRCREPLDGDAETSPTVAVPSRGQYTVLLAEDNAELRASIEEALRNLGYAVSAAASGEEALRLYEEDRSIDLLITDVVMPGINGRELLDRLREESAELQAIFISGYTDDVVLNHGVAEDDVSFLQKPFSLAELTTRIEETLQRSR